MYADEDTYVCMKPKGKSCNTYDQSEAVQILDSQGPWREPYKPSKKLQR